MYTNGDVCLYGTGRKRVNAVIFQKYQMFGAIVTTTLESKNRRPGIVPALTRIKS